jgi:excisionase family DNA binding protein
MERTMDTEKPKKLLTYTDAAKILSLHPASVRRLVAEGKLSHCKVGRAVRFTEDDLIGKTHVPARGSQ